MLIPIGFFGAGGAGGAYELIETTILGSDTSSVTFSSIPSTYKHLQVRITARSTDALAGAQRLIVQFNGDTGSNYAAHNLFSDGSALSSNSNTSQTHAQLGYTLATSSNTANVFGSFVMDLMDYASTTKYKTNRVISGLSSNATRLSFNSGLWMSTSAVTSMTFDSLDTTKSIIAGSRFSLYGLKG